MLWVRERFGLWFVEEFIGVDVSLNFVLDLVILV